MRRNAGPIHTNPVSSHRPKPRAQVQGGIHKLSSQSLATLKVRLATSDPAFEALAEPAMAPLEHVAKGQISLDRNNVTKSTISTESEPCIRAIGFSPRVESAQRRSSFLAESMLKEQLSCDKIGYDRDGRGTYVMRMIESQGFRWNRYLNRVEGCETFPSPQLDYLEGDSDCSTTDDDESEIL